MTFIQIVSESFDLDKLVYVEWEWVPGETPLRLQRAGCVFVNDAVLDVYGDDAQRIWDYCHRHRLELKQ